MRFGRRIRTVLGVMGATTFLVASAWALQGQGLPPPFVESTRNRLGLRIARGDSPPRVPGSFAVQALAP